MEGILFSNTINAFTRPAPIGTEPIIRISGLPSALMSEKFNPCGVFEIGKFTAVPKLKFPDVLLFCRIVNEEGVL